MRNFFPTSLNQPIKLYQLGLYGQDEWKVKSNLKLTLALRADHNSNPLCGTNCFAQFNGNWGAIDHSATTPYNTDDRNRQESGDSFIHEDFPAAALRILLATDDAEEHRVPRRYRALHGYIPRTDC